MKYIPKKNQDTRQMVLDAATKLFYDNGLENTTISQIAKEAGLSIGSITYYFDNKTELAVTTQRDYLKKCNAFAAEQIKKFDTKLDEKLFFVVASFFEEILTYEDDKAQRFWVELLKIGSSQILAQKEGHYIDLFMERGLLSLSDFSDERSISLYACGGAHHSMDIAFYSGLINCSFDEFFKYLTLYSFHTLKVDKNEAEKYYEKGMELIKKIDYTVKPYFVIE